MRERVEVRSKGTSSETRQVKGLFDTVVMGELLDHS